MTPMDEPPRLSRDLLQFAAGNAKRVLPRGGFELAGGVAHQRLRQAVGALDEIETEAALGAEEIAIDAALVAIVGADDFWIRRWPGARRA
jgi:hypothetical protein